MIYDADKDMTYKQQRRVMIAIEVIGWLVIGGLSVLTMALPWLLSAFWG